jgi:hypothetical protein
MLSFGVTIPATVPQGSEIPEGLMNNPVFVGRVPVVGRDGQTVCDVGSPKILILMII